jgi:hypothetical protein
MNIVKEQQIDKELEKLGGPLANMPINRWFAYNKIPYSIFGISALGTIMSVFFMTTVARPLKANEEKISDNKYSKQYVVNPKTETYRNIANNSLVFFLANFIFWGCLIVSASRHANLERDAVALMLKLKEEFPNDKLNEKAVAKALKHVPYIISKMSASERVYFDKLNEGKIQITDDKLFRDTAITIIAGYLQTHPEDLCNLNEILRKHDDFKRQNEIQR